MSGRIVSTADRLVILWFSKMDRDRGLWTQIQVTLVGARLKRANLEILDTLPQLRSYDIKVISSEPPRREFKLDFEPGSLCYECDDIVHSKFSRKIVFEPRVDE
ncbi:MAG: hypothetical protein FJX11_23850 [Alphaproteobacteria bacterium]|nr:hypothetical protein [Alphaproteobacteria bacterium]